MRDIGILYCVDRPGVKLYILIVTCAVTRAVHFELVDSLGGSDVVLALRRVTARRGISTFIYCDNAKAFKLAPALLAKYFGHLSPKWIPIAPRAPWWGGWWERLNCNLKSGLKRSIGLKCLRRTELETTLHEVEACVNSCLLTFISDEVKDPSPLTPAHFLIGTASPFIPPVSDDVVTPANVNPTLLVNQKLFKDEALRKFWKIWSNLYIKNLPPARAVKSKGDIRVGSYVMLREDNIPRLQWPCGVVVDLHVGGDGVVRTVTVKTPKGQYTRPIQRIHDLELCDTIDASSADSVQPVEDLVPSGPAEGVSQLPDKGAAQLQPAVAKKPATAVKSAKKPVLSPSPPVEEGPPRRRSARIREQRN